MCSLAQGVPCAEEACLRPCPCPRLSLCLSLRHVSLRLQLRQVAQGVLGAEAARRVDAQKLAQQVAQLPRQRLRRVRGPRVAVHAVGVRRGVVGVGEGRVTCETRECD